MSSTAEGYQITPQQKWFWKQAQRGAHPVTQVLCHLGPELHRDKVVAGFEQAFETRDILRSELFLPSSLNQPLLRVVENATLQVLFRDEPLPTDWWHVGLEMTNLGLDFWPAEQGASWCLVSCPGALADRASLVQWVGEILLNLHQQPSPEAVPYLSYAEWVNGLEHSEVHAEAHAFWRERIPTDITRLPGTWAAPGTWQRLVRPLPACLVPQGARFENVAEFQACLAFYLARYFRWDHAQLAVQVPGRSFEELSTTLGPFAKYVPMDLPYLEHTEVRTWHAQWEARFEELLEWQDFYGEDALPAPLPICFSVWESLASGHGFAVVSCFEAPPPCQLQITLDVVHQNVIWDYRCGEIHPASLTALAKGFETCLKAARAQPETPLGTVPLLDEADTNHLHALGFEGLNAEAHGEIPIHQRFFVQAAKTPQRLAVISKDQAWSYARLATRSRQLAAILQEGVSPGGVIALRLRRSPDLVASLLAAMLSQTTYLVLDPHWPEGRCQALLDDSGASILLTESSLEATALEIPISVQVDTVVELTASTDAPLPAFPATPTTRPVYRIYTSGSTGTPKAVEIGHRQISHYTSGLVQRLGLGEGLRYGLISSLAADLGYTAFFPPLATAGTLVLVDEDTAVNPSAFRAFVASHPLDVLKITPSHFRVLMAGKPSRDLLPQVMLIFGGEAVDPSWIRQLQEVAPDLALVNHYGPTETTVGVLCWKFANDGRFPLGKPLPGTRVILKDHQDALVALGAVGEICISGPSLAAGYANNPAQTAANFGNTSHAPPFDRFYRTGDLGMVDSEGIVTFLGRRDFQVKIRGFRVELGEIEGILSRQPAVQEAVVMLIEQEPGLAQVLHAFFLATEKVDPEMLRAGLQAVLPEYMVPGTFQQLTEWPLAINGKIDRQKLREWALTANTSRALGSLPGTPVQRVVAKIWCDILGLAEGSFDIETPFFQLGGHSLLLIMLSTRIEKIFGVAMGIDQLFQANTIAKMEALLLAKTSLATERTNQLLDLLTAWETSRQNLPDSPGSQPAIPDSVLNAMTAPTGTDEPEPPILTPSGTHAAYPLSFEQQRLWFLYCFQDRSAAYNNPASFRVHGPVSALALAQSFGLLEARHPALRTRFRNKEGTAEQIMVAPRSTPLTLINLQGLPPHQQEAQIAILQEKELATPFQLEHSNPWRAQWLRLGEQQHVLLYTIHHICSDGWSMRLFVKDLFAFYRALSSGRPPSLPPLTLHYGDYARWQQAFFSQERLQEARVFWQTYFRDADFSPLLVYDTSSASSAGTMLPLTVATPLAERIRKLADAQGVTLFTFLVTAYSLTFRYLTKRDDLVIGTDVANRNQKDTEHILGFFVNQLGLRFQFKANPTLTDILLENQGTVSKLLAYQSFPFSEVVNALALPRESHQTPLFQTKLFLEHREPTHQDLPLLTFEKRVYETASARLDLTLGLWNQPGGDIRGWLNYPRERFHATTIQRVADTFLQILKALVDQPAQSLAALMLALAQQEAAQPLEAATALPAVKRSQRRRGPLVVATESLVEEGPLFPGQSCPWRIRPQRAGVDLAGWLAGNTSHVEHQLAMAGAILFEGFPIHQVEAFEAVANQLIGQVFKDNSEHQPITANGSVQIPVDYAADQHLLWHNENTFNYHWPTKILFGCDLVAEHGGETPFVDSQAVCKALPADVRNAFLSKGVQYMRTYSQEVGLSWQTVFKTTSRAEVEEKCRQDHFEFRWLAGDRLQTRASRPAAIYHWHTKDLCWINQVLHWHFACLPADTQASIARLFPPDEYPRNCFFGDGSPIPEAYIHEIRKVYQSLEVVYPWAKGNLLLLDNARVAHARKPFQGKRRIWVCMGDLTSYTQHPLQIHPKDPRP